MNIIKNKMLLMIFLLLTNQCLSKDLPDIFSRSADNASELKRELKKILLPNGITLDYAEQGDASGIPVLLLHGWTDSWRSFELVLPHLPSSIHTISISLRGHGDSDRPEEGYFPKDFADDVAAFMDQLNIKSAVIVGHSMGSTIAQRFGIDYPEKTSGLILISSSTTWKGNKAVMEVLDMISGLSDPIDPEFVREFQQGLPAQPVPPEFIEMTVHENLKVPAQVWKATLKALSETDFSDELYKIQSPTLILWSVQQEPFISPKEQESLLNLIQNSKLITYKDAGHCIHWEEPERVANDIISFVHLIDNSNAD